MSPPRAAPPARLRRMQRLATGLLLLMGGLFVAALELQARWPAAAYGRAFAEAALVGGCADWFAVTALFRRPLGLPIPHTAIIPRGKDRIGAALGRFIVEEFLSPRVLDSRLRQWEIGEWGGAWLGEPANARRLADRGLKLAAQLAPMLPAEAVEALVASALAGVVRATPAAPAASALLAALWDRGRAQPLVERMADLLAAYLAEHQGVILDKVQGQSWRWMPAFVDRAVARKVTAGLVQLLAEVRQPDHPWRLSLASTVERLIERLAHDPALRAEGERLKAQVLADPRLAARLQALRGQLRQQLAAGGLGGGSGELRLRLEELILAAGAWLRRDPQVQRALKRSARALTRRVLAPRRHALARYVERTVAGWDARGVVERLEHQVGPDLQYVRLSGTIVGGLVGLALFALSRLLIR